MIILSRMLQNCRFSACFKMWWRWKNPVFKYTGNVGSDIWIVYRLFDMFCKSFSIFIIAAKSEIQKERYDLLFEIMTAYKMSRKPPLWLTLRRSLYELIWLDWIEDHIPYGIELVDQSIYRKWRCDRKYQKILRILFLNGEILGHIWQFLSRRLVVIYPKEKIGNPPLVKTP